jgi:hypothetical protein
MRATTEVVCAADSAKRAKGLVAVIGSLLILGALVPLALGETTPDAQSCIDSALERPQIRFTGMVYPGDRRKQTLELQARISSIPETCRQEVTRPTPKAIFMVQSPRNHKRWFRSKPRGFRVENAPVGDDGGISDAAFEGFGGNKGLDYRCTPGKGITHVKAVLKLDANSSADGQVLGRKSYPVPIRVLPVPRIDPVQGGGVRKAC